MAEHVATDVLAEHLTADALMSVSESYLAQSNTANILVTIGVWCFIAVVVVALRLYVRARMLRYVGADDLTMTVAMLLGVGLFTIFVGESKHGLGRHYETFIDTNMSSLLHWEFVHSLISLFGITAVKISVSLLLLRIATRRYYRIFLWSLITFLILYTLMCAFTITFACLPISANWDVAELATAKCFSNDTFTALGLTNSVCNMLTDAILALLPIPMIMNLQLNVRAKIALTAILALGFVSVACGAVKTHYQLVVKKDPDSRYHDNFYIWAAIELYVGIVACSLPTLKPLLTKFLDAARSSAGRSGNGRTSDYTRNNTTFRSNLSNGFRKQFDKKPLTTTMPLDDIHSISSSPKNKPDDIESFFGVTTTAQATHDAVAAPAPHGRVSYEESIHDGSSQNSSNGPVDAFGITRTTKVITTTESRAAPTKTSAPLRQAKAAGSNGDNSSVHQLIER